MSEMKITVKPIDAKHWGLYLDDKLIGKGKLQCDVMVAAKRFVAIYEVPPEIVLETN